MLCVEPRQQATWALTKTDTFVLAFILETSLSTHQSKTLLMSCYCSFARLGAIESVDQFLPGQARGKMIEARLKHFIGAHPRVGMGLSNN